MLWPIEPAVVLEVLRRRRCRRGGGLAVAARAHSGNQAASSPVRVAAVFLTSMNTKEIWPHPGFDTRGRQEEVLTVLRLGCPDIDFQPLTVDNPADLAGVAALKDHVQGILVYLIRAIAPFWVI